MDKFHSDSLQISAQRIETVKSSVQTLVNLFKMGLHLNKYKIKYDDMILSDPLYENLRVVEIEHVDVILPIIIPETKLETFDGLPGYVCLKIPQEKIKKFKNVKSDSSAYVSLAIVAQATWKCMGRCLANQTSFELMPLDVATYGHVIHIRNIREPFIVKICIGVKFDFHQNCRITTKPLDSDAHLGSDFLWRITFIERELKLMSSVNRIDGLKHVQALRILLGLIKLDRMFKSLHEYHVFTVFLHTCENEMRFKNWDTKDLIECVYILVLSLLGFLVAGNLPHFFLQNLNLFLNLKFSERTLLIGRLKSILSNKNELKRLLERRTVTN
jgi:hypothetical protein